MFTTIYNHKSTRKSLCGFLLVLLTVASFLISPDSASASTPLSLRVNLKATNNNPISGQTVELCHQGSGEWLCTVDPVNTSGTDGNITSSLQLPNDSGPVLINAGGPGTVYSRNSVLVFFRNGNISSQPELTLTGTTWRTVNVRVLDSGTPVSNEWVRLSILEDADSFWVESDQTDDFGIATFEIDETRYVERYSEVVNGSVIAKFGQFGSKYNYAQTPITLDDSGLPVPGQVTLNTSSVLYTLSGTVTDFDHTVGASSFFNNRKMCLRYQDPGTARGVERDFETNSLGFYSVSLVTNPSVSFQPFPCGGQDNWRTYDDIPERTVSPAGAAATLNFQLTRTRLKVKVTYLDGSTVKDAAFVYVGIDGLNEDFEPQDRKVELTDAQGFATFTGLLESTDYQVSFRESDREYEAPRFEDNVLATTLTTGGANSVNETVPVLSLVKLEPFPDLPVSVEGTVFGPGGIPIANAEVDAVASYGNEPNEYVNYKVRTDKLGKYYIGSLPYGSIRIEVSASRFRSFERIVQTSLDDDVLEPGKYEDINFRIRPSAAGSLEYSGVLRDSSGIPIPEIELILNYPMASGGDIQRQITDSEGRFVFSRLTSGQYSIFPELSRTDFAWTTWTANVSPDSFPQNASLVLMGKNEANSGNQAKISGRVVEYLDTAGPTGAVPIEGVCVEVYPTQGGSGTLATTDATGKWEALGLVEGEEYSVGTPSQCPDEELQLEIFDLPSKYELPQPSSSLLEAKADDGVMHQWSYMEVSRSGPGSITGRVKDSEDYSNLPGVLVRLERIRGGIEIQPEFTDDRGEYSFENLPAGDYLLIIEGSFIGEHEYQGSTISVDVRGIPNRVNAILGRASSEPFIGIASGVVRDELGELHEKGSVEVFDPTNPDFLRTAQTNQNGEFQIDGLPVDKLLSYRIIPFWSEIARFIDTFTIPSGEDESSEIELPIVDLAEGSSISGHVFNIPQGQFTKPIIAELLQPDGEAFQVVNSAEVNRVTGLYEIGQVPIGSYIIRFTQNPAGSYSESSIEESISMKPVYWNGSRLGTPSLDEADQIDIVSEGEVVVSKNVTFSRGAVLQGSLSVATSSGVTPLSGSRSVSVDLYKEISGDWQLVTSAKISGSSDYEYQFVGLAEGNYIMHFIDSRRGENSLTSNYYGNATTRNLADVIEIEDLEVIENTRPQIINHVMSMAAPERSAEAFDLDDLNAEILAQLRDEISLSSEAASGANLEIFVGTEFAGEFVSAYANSTPVLLGDWKQVDSRGYITVTIPTNLPDGSHRIAAQDSRGVVFGWAPISIRAPDAAAANPATNPAASKAKTAEPKTAVDPETEEEKNEPANKEKIEAATVASESSRSDWLFPLAGGFLLVLSGAFVWAYRSRRVVDRK